MREKIEKECSENEAAASEPKRFTRTATGQSSKEVDQPELLSNNSKSCGSFFCCR